MTEPGTITVGPIGIPFFGVFLSRWNLRNWMRFPLEIGRKYPTICMYPYGPWSYGVMMTDKAMIRKYSKMDAFTNRPPFWAQTAPPNEPPPHSTINGGDMWERRKLFQSTMVSMTDSKFFSEFVRTNIREKLLFPSVDRAIAEKHGLWEGEDVWDAVYSFTFNTIYGASFGQSTLDPLDAD